MTVWDALIGQPEVAGALESAAAAARLAGTEGQLAAARAGMTHAWLFTGPAGSGRSVAARAFAAALSCERDPAGCGECNGCRTVLAGTAADVKVIRPEGLSVGVKEVRELVRDAAGSPTSGAWRVLLVEDVDRLTEQAFNALLKALEEPADRSVFLLCAPAVDDVPPTVRSRCRSVRLRLPRPVDVTAVLVADGVDPDLAAVAARAAQGHVGRARRIANDPAARKRRAEVLRLPTRLGSVAECLTAAKDLVDAATAEAGDANTTRSETETESLKAALGVGMTKGSAKGSGAGRTVAVRGAATALKELERSQKSRGKRSQLDALDRALVDLAGWYRDVLTVQLGAAVDPVHPDQRDAVAEIARSSTPERTLRRIEALVACRESLAETPGLAPLVTVEALALTLRDG